jgi:DNA processing protein
MLPGLSARQKLALLERFSDPEDIYYTDKFDHIPDVTAEMAEALENKDLTPAQKVLRTCAEKKIGILSFHDAAYPQRLRNIHEPPILLYYKGTLPDFEAQPVIGVVGTRKASAYGLHNARQFSQEIAACGGLVVSGGAYGVDTAALEGALQAGKETVAVLGCGVDVVYPRTNRLLFARIEDSGCLLSEYLPGTGPKPWQFPERNRIISGLSNGVLVVEAPEKSGALITARNAFEQGREVFVIPGNIGVASGLGSNKLLQEYGGAVFSGWDVLKDYAPQYPGIVQMHKVSETPMPPVQVAQERKIPILDKKDIDNPVITTYSVLDTENSQYSQQERDVLACLDSIPRPVDEVIARAGLPAAEVLSILTKLALKGAILNHPGRLVSARK